jgi:outer membrane receptor protein involved in Fe transport
MWFDNRLKVNAALYYIDWKNMQVALVRSSDGRPYVGNIGRARSYGLELEMDARPIDNLGVGLNLTLQKANVTELTSEQALISGATQGASLSSPESKVGGYIEYNWSVGNLGGMYARIDVQYVGSYTNTFPNSPGSTNSNAFYKIVPSYENANFSLGWTRDSIRTTLYVENLFDDDTPIFINAANFSTGTNMTLRPRTVGVRLGLTY